MKRFASLMGYPWASADRSPPLLGLDSLAEGLVVVVQSIELARRPEEVRAEAPVVAAYFTKTTKAKKAMTDRLRDLGPPVLQCLPAIRYTFARSISPTRKEVLSLARLHHFHRGLEKS